MNSLFVDCSKYTVSIKWVQLITPKDKDNIVFYGVFLNHMFSKLHLQQIGRKHFNVNSSISVRGHNITILPGYASSVEVFKTGILVNIDISHRVLRQDTAYDVISQARGGRNAPSTIKKALEAAVVLTQYNKSCTYTIKDVKFDMSPKSTFPQFDRVTKERKEISYADYYEKQYGITIEDLDQPLLEHYDKKQRRSIFLIPALCKMTGLSDNQRKDFRLMKEMANTTHKKADKRLEDIKGLFELIHQSDKCKELMEQWNIKIDEKPLEIKGKMLNPANLVMGMKGGKRNEIPTDNEANADRLIQTEMYEHKKLGKWGIMYNSRDEKTYKQFISEFNNACNTYQFKTTKPREFRFK